MDHKELKPDTSKLLYSSGSKFRGIAVINKIDLPQAEPDRVKQEIEDMIGLDAIEAPMVSAKTGVGIDELLSSLVESIPSPKAISMAR